LISLNSLNFGYFLFSIAATEMGSPSYKAARITVFGKALYAILGRENPNQGGNDLSNLKRMVFDCRGHMTDVTDTQGAGDVPTVYLPPQSIGAKLATIACGNR
jgi:hypothetical protein